MQNQDRIPSNDTLAILVLLLSVEQISVFMSNEAFVVLSAVLAGSVVDYQYISSAGLLGCEGGPT